MLTLSILIFFAIILCAAMLYEIIQSDLLVESFEEACDSIIAEELE